MQKRREVEKKETKYWERVLPDMDYIGTVCAAQSVRFLSHFGHKYCMVFAA